MEEKIISFETAKLCKEKGFNLPTPHCYVHTDGEEYDIELFSFLLGGEGFLKDVYDQEKELRNFDTTRNLIINESEVYFDYNQDIRKLLTLLYNGEEYMNDEKSYSMYLDSYVFDKLTSEEHEALKSKLPNYNNGDFEVSVYQDVISAPTQALLQKWLRDEHKIDIQILGSYKSTYYCHVFKADEDYLGMYAYEFPTYEDALEYALLDALNKI